jgi:hypothetical protein
LISKSYFKKTSDNDLRWLISNGRSKFILDRGALRYGSFLFIGLFASRQIVGTATLEEDVLISLSLSAMAGVVFGFYLWNEVKKELKRRESEKQPNNLTIV